MSDPASPTPTFLTLESVDVVHSFWVPQLAGKMDVIPNKTNRMWIDPRTPGTYVGQCAEYCGTPARAGCCSGSSCTRGTSSTAGWRPSRRPARDDPAVRGRVASSSLSLACINCHTVRGTPANGVFGPDLTHLMSRATIGGRRREQYPGDAARVGGRPGRDQAGALMPAMKLSSDELNQLTAYLLTLR